jgi:chorismate mutase
LNIDLVTTILALSSALLNFLAKRMNFGMRVGCANQIA